MAAHLPTPAVARLAVAVAFGALVGGAVGVLAEPSLGVLAGIAAAMRSVPDRASRSSSTSPNSPPSAAATMTSSMTTGRKSSRCTTRRVVSGHRSVVVPVTRYAAERASQSRPPARWYPVSVAPDGSVVSAV